jgi:hypothetical protein
MATSSIFDIHTSVAVSEIYMMSELDLIRRTGDPTYIPSSVIDLLAVPPIPRKTLAQIVMPSPMVELTPK